MSIRSTLAALRAGRALSPTALAEFARGLAMGEVSDAQAGAFAMGICHNALSSKARTALTRAMCDTGQTLQWKLEGPVADKHSTGGVGDCVSLLLAPALAACGVYVPMVSGRGLGHTGGTLDKLSAIPGFRTDLSIDEMQRIVAETGCVICSATADIAPADRRLYAVRDVTSTVESLDLIVASILSKKLAEGLEALVLDVKCGSGALIPDMSAARSLAQALVETSQAAGVMTTALLTDMSQPAATAAGNALEVNAAMEALTDPNARSSARLVALTKALGGECLALSGLAADAADGELRIETALTSGAAVETLGHMIAAQGGPLDFPERWRDRLPAAPVVAELRADAPGVVDQIDTRVLGEIVVDLGGGRRKETDSIDLTVGIGDVVPLGTVVSEGQPLARVHASDADQAEEAAARLVDAITFAARPSTAPDLVREVIR